MSRISIHDALGVLIAAGEARKEQFEGMGKGRAPDEVIGDLCASASTGNLDAQDQAAMIEAAIDKVRIFRDSVL